MKAFEEKDSHSIFEFDDYRAYLEAVIRFKDGSSRGFRSQLAERIGVQRTFVSQVLKGTAHFNLEHGEAISGVLGHTDEEANFFILLILFARAGTPPLRERLKSQIDETREKRRVLKNRFEQEEALSLEDRVEYYGTWLYGALRVLLTIPKYQSRQEVEKYFDLPQEQISAALEFLISRGLIAEVNGRLEATQKHMYLGNDSRLVAKHHINWKMRAIQSLDHEKKTDLHYSTVSSLSRKDVVKVREAIARTLEEIRNTVKESDPECLYTLCVDYFEC